MPFLEVVLQTYLHFLENDCDEEDHEIERVGKCLNQFNYCQFHKTLPTSSLQMHWILVRFYEMGDIQITLQQNNINYILVKDESAAGP